MTTMPDLPRGMRLNNPGNLRANTIPEMRTKIVDGFAQFPSLDLGVEALSRLVYRYYTVHHWITPFDFVSHYAPATENDVSRYVKFVCRDLQLNPLHASTDDLRLDKAWNALNLMRAIVRIEQGRPASSYKWWPEWVSPTAWVVGMSRCHAWNDL